MGRPGYQQTPALPDQRTDLERSRIMTPPDEPALRETRIGAYGICICDDRILVVRKAKGPYKGLYDLPGGGVEFGESPTETVAREFLEEAGVAVEVKELVGSFSLVSVFPADSGTHLVELHHLGFPVPGESGGAGAHQRGSRRPRLPRVGLAAAQRRKPGQALPSGPRELQVDFQPGIGYIPPPGDAAIEVAVARNGSNRLPQTFPEPSLVPHPIGLHLWLPPLPSSRHLRNRAPHPGPGPGVGISTT